MPFGLATLDQSLPRRDSYFVETPARLGRVLISSPPPMQKDNVRFVPKIGHRYAVTAYPLRAKSGYEQSQQDTRPDLPLFDHLISTREERRRDGETKRLGDLEIDHQLKLGRLLHGQVGRLLAFEDPCHVGP